MKLNQKINNPKQGQLVQAWLAAFYEKLLLIVFFGVCAAAMMKQRRCAATKDVIFGEGSRKYRA